MQNNWLKDFSARAKRAANAFNAPTSLPSQISETADVVFLRALKEMNCGFTATDLLEGQNKTKIWEGEFSFHGGKFLAWGFEGDVFACILYPNFFTTSISNIDFVRALVNQLNTGFCLHHVSYNIDEENSIVNVSIYIKLLAVGNIPNFNEYLAKVLDHCFETQHNFERRWEEPSNYTDFVPVTDHELQKASSVHINSLISESLAQAFRNPVLWTENTTTDVTLGQLLLSIFSADPNWVNLVRVYHGSCCEEFTDTDEINSLVITDYIINSDRGAKEASFHDAASGTATIHVYYNEQRSVTSEVEVNRHLSIVLSPMREDSNALYYSVTATFVPLQPSPMITMVNKEAEPKTLHFVMAYDRHDSVQNRAEARFMIAEAKEKIKQGEKVSEQMRLALNCENSDEGFNIYMGTKRFDENRFYEAILYLENAHVTMRQRYSKLNHDGRHAFAMVELMLGISYCQMYDFERGGYYLEQIKNASNIKIAEAYINCKIAMGDERITRYLKNLKESADEVLNEADEDFERDETSMELAKRFLLLVNRTHAYLLLQKGELDQAEKIYKSLLNIDSTANEAMTQLAKIQRLRNQE